MNTNLSLIKQLLANNSLDLIYIFSLLLTITDKEIIINLFKTYLYHFDIISYQLNVCNLILRYLFIQLLTSNDLKEKYQKLYNLNVILTHKDYTTYEEELLITTNDTNHDNTVQDDFVDDLKVIKQAIHYFKNELININ